MSRKTVGQMHLDALSKTPDSLDPVELQEVYQAQQFETELVQAIEEGKKKYEYPYYVVVLTKKEPLLDRVFRQYFLPRQTCPSPEYDQTVFKVHTDAIEYVWTVPDKNTAHYLYDNALSVVKEEKWLRDMCIAFFDKSLLYHAMKENNEICSKEDTCQKCKTKSSAPSNKHKQKNQQRIIA